MQGQGIQSLAPMGGPQQKPMGGMPQAPMGGSMGGLGSVEDRVAAFRGRPEQLQQKYAMSQDLLDLLALQKIKSEKEAAARQMQLAMNQQAMQNGQMPTVAQQREQEVHQLTKNELAQQRAATDQQKQQEEQEALQQLANSGIATAPGANTVGMAQGGIIGFDGRDPDYGSEVPYIPEADDSLLVNASAEVPVDMYGVPLDQFGEPVVRDRTGRTIKSLFNYEKALDIDPLKNNPELKAALEREIAQRSNEGGGKKSPPSTPAGEQPEKPGYKVEQLTPPAAPPQARPPAPIGGGTGVGKPPKIPDRTDDGGLAKLLRDQMSIDPAAVGRTARDEAAAYMKPTAEQEALYRKGIADQERMYAENFDPEKMKWASIGALLRGAGGRRWNVLGAAGDAMAEYDQNMQVAQNKAQRDLQAARQGLVSLQREHLKDAVGAGTHAAQTAGTQAAHAMSASTNLFDAVVRQDIARQQLAAEIWGKQLQHSADMARTQVMRDQTILAQQGKTQDIAAHVYTSFNAEVAKEKKLVWDAYKNAAGLFEGTPDPTPEMKDKLLQLQQTRDTQLQTIDTTYSAMISRTLNQLGLPGGSEPSAVRVTKITPPPQ